MAPFAKLPAASLANPQAVGDADGVTFPQRVRRISWLSWTGSAPLCVTFSVLVAAFARRRAAALTAAIWVVYAVRIPLPHIGAAVVRFSERAISEPCLGNIGYLFRR